MTVTVSGLTVGQPYAVQTWVNDSRNIGGGRTETVNGGGNTTTFNYPANSQGRSGNSPRDISWRTPRRKHLR